MRSHIPYRILTLGFAILLLTACKSEKKTATYKSIYNERPVTIYIAPVQDVSKRKDAKYDTEVAYNEERNMAARYLQLILDEPLSKQGYYVVPLLASKQIASQEQATVHELYNGDLKHYAQQYGIDAVLLVRIHRWADNSEEVVLFIEYTLRSCKSNSDLMHCWVRASQKALVDYHGDPLPLPAEQKLMRDYGMDVTTARRCRLTQEVSRQVLRDLPFSAIKRQFERDRYRNANRDYFSFQLTEHGDMELQAITMEAFEEECFIN